MDLKLLVTNERAWNDCPYPARLVEAACSVGVDRKMILKALGECVARI